MLKQLMYLSTLVLGVPVCGQYDMVDSLRSLRDQGTNDNERVELAIEMLIALRQAGDTNYIPLVDSTLSAAIKAERSDLYAKALLEKGSFYDLRGRSDSALHYYTVAKRFCVRNKLDKELGYTLFYLAGIARYRGQHQKAYDTYGEAIKVFERLDMAPQLATLAFSQAVILDNMGQFGPSASKFYDALEQFEALEDDYGIGNCHNSLGLLQQRTRDLTGALAHYRQALQFMTRAGVRSQICNIQDNIGGVHRMLGDVDSALHYSQQALNVRRAIGDAYGIGRGSINLAEDYRALREYSAAGASLAEAIRIFENIGDRQSLSLAKARMAQIYSLEGKHAMAAKFGEEALGLARETASLNEAKEAHRQLVDINERWGRNAEALQHYKEYAQLKDSILSQENLAVLSELRTRYESEKKDNLLLEKDLELKTSEAALVKKTLVNRTIAIALAGSLLAMGLLVFNFMQRRKLHRERMLNLEHQQQVASMQAMMSGEERERSRIAKDLHDGLNGTLATVKMYLGGLTEEAPGLEGSSRFIKMRDMLDDTTNEVRRISHDLMPNILMREGLVAALNAFCDNINAAGVLHVECITSGIEGRFSNRFELTLYRVIQELMNNIIKHASAKEVTLQLFRLDDTLQVTVEDDGIGFDPQSSTLGLGLDSIRSRVEMLAGRSEIQSTPGKGTTVHMEFQLSKHATIA